MYASHDSVFLFTSFTLFGHDCAPKSWSENRDGLYWFLTIIPPGNGNFGVISKMYRRIVKHWQFYSKKKRLRVSTGRPITRIPAIVGVASVSVMWLTVVGKPLQVSHFRSSRFDIWTFYFFSSYIVCTWPSNRRRALVPVRILKLFSRRLEVVFYGRLGVLFALRRAFVWNVSGQLPRSRPAGIH